MINSSFCGPALIWLKTLSVLTWVSIYWYSTAGPAASVRIYYEKVHGPSIMKDTPGIPHGYSYFPLEIHIVPRS